MAECVIVKNFQTFLEFESKFRMLIFGNIFQFVKKNNR